MLSPEEKSLQDAASLLQSHCNQLAPPLQKACSATATGLQQNCNECAAEQIEKVMKHHPCQQSMFCNPNAVISFCGKYSPKKQRKATEVKAFGNKTDKAVLR
ncbi:hypothetical protein ACFX5L_03070 [Bacteroides sp. KG123]|uniref:hypothetical protein n=1 Tax=unclassified Bacteroides TaxID=2646097 RepID=UPI003D7F50D8